MIINKTDWDQFTEKDKRLLKGYIKFLLKLQSWPKFLHDPVRKIGDQVFYKL